MADQPPTLPHRPDVGRELTVMTCPDCTGVYYAEIGHKCPTPVFYVTTAANMPDGSGYYEIHAPDESTARALAFAHCPGGRWSFLYHSLEKVHPLDRKKHGTIRSAEDPAEVTDWVPIYEKDGNEFFICGNDYRADNEEDAHMIGLGTMLVECILLGMKFKRTAGINRKLLPHAKAHLLHLPVAMISGPLFDEASKPDAVPLCASCGRPSPERAWCSKECEDKDSQPANQPTGEAAAG